MVATSAPPDMQCSKDGGLLLVLSIENFSTSFLGCARKILPGADISLEGKTPVWKLPRRVRGTLPYIVQVVRDPVGSKPIVTRGAGGYVADLTATPRYVATAQ
jgi:hypothetical protein